METMDDGDAGASFGQALVFASKLPSVRIERAAFIRRSLVRHCAPEQIAEAVATTPARAGVSAEVLRKAADASIRHESSKVTQLCLPLREFQAASP
jgi:hypothetical protein